MLKKFFEEITYFGGISFFLLIIFLSALLKKELFIKLIFALFSIYLLAFLIRIFYFKPRPERVKYSNFIGKLDASSFPSVHTSRITFLFLFSSFFLQLHAALVFLFAIVAILAVYSRIYLRKHDLIDVIGGLVLGILVFLVSIFF